MNFYQRMGILPLKKCVNRDKCSFATKQRMFGVFAIDEILRYRGTRFPGSCTSCHPVIGQSRICFYFTRRMKTYWKFTLGPDAHMTGLVGRGRWINNIPDELHHRKTLYHIEIETNCEVTNFAIFIDVIAGSLFKQRPQPMQGSRQRCWGSGRNALRCWVSQ